MMMRGLIVVLERLKRLYLGDMMVEVIESNKRLAHRRIKILRAKFEDEYNIWFVAGSWGTPHHVQVYLKKGKIFSKYVLDVFPTDVSLYKKGYLEFAKRICKLLEIERLELHYLEDG